MNIKPIYSSILITVICCIGLLYQVTEVTKSYLSYRIRRIISRDFPTFLDPPAISLCFDLSVVIPIEVFKSITSKHRETASSEYWGNFYDFLKVTPIKELFKLSPKVNETLKNSFGCAIRFPTEYSMFFMDNKDCYGHFVIEKYIQRQLMCYKFTPIVDGIDIGEYQMNHPKNRSKNGQRMMGKSWALEYLMAPVKTGVLYTLYMNFSSFNRVSYVVAFVHGPDTDHFEDSFITNQNSMTLSKDRGTAMKTNYQRLTYHHLEAPYPSKCYKMSNGKSLTHEFADLLNIQTIKQFNSTCPVTQLFENNSSYTNYNLISDRDYGNKTFLNTFNDLIERNEKYYKGLSCDLRYYVTSVTTQSIGVSKRSHNRFIIYITWPQLHNIEMNDDPLQSMLDLLIYVASSLGFWFGFSVLSSVSMVGNWFKSIITKNNASDFNHTLNSESTATIGEKNEIKNQKEVIIQLTKMVKSQQKVIELNRQGNDINRRNIVKLLTQLRGTESRVNHLYTERVVKN